MKVLIVRTFPDILNLNTYNVQEIGLAKALACKGVECGVVLYHGKNSDKTEKVFFTKDGKEYFYMLYWLKGFSVFKNGFMPSVYKLIPEYDVVQVHEYDQIFSWMIYIKQQKPTIIYHGPYHHEYAKGYNLKCKVFDNLFLRWRKHDHVVALTKSGLAAEFLKGKGFQHVYPVGVGVDADKFQVKKGEDIRCLLERDPSKFRLLYVGKIEERRNVYFLAELFTKLTEKYDDVELVIVGDGEPEYVSAFLHYIDKWVKNGKIKYFQRASQKELSMLYQNVDLFLFTSNYEIFGMVLLEALYFRLPVVSSVNGGSSVLIREGENGYVLDKFEVEEWMEKVECILNDRHLYSEMKSAAHRMIVDGFMWDKLADRFIMGYEKAVKVWTQR